MKRSMPLLLAAVLALSLGGGAADAARKKAPKDKKPPVVTVTTEHYAIFCSTSGIAPGSDVSFCGTVEGVANDESSGIKSISVRFIPCSITSYDRTSSSPTCRPGLAPPADPPNGSCGAAGCAMPVTQTCATPKSCGFSAYPPYYPGAYEVRVEAVDKAGNKGRGPVRVVLVL